MSTEKRRKKTDPPLPSPHAPSAAPAPAAAHHERHGYEFGGPLGAAAITFGLPIVVYLSTFLCNDLSGCPVPSLLHPKSLSLDKLKAEAGWTGVCALFDLNVTLWVMGYHLLSLVLQLLLPGQMVQGTELASGGRLMYKFNSFNSALVTVVGLAAGTFIDGANFVVWTFIWENLNQIVTANVLICLAESVYVYLRSFSVPPPGAPNPDRRELAKGGHTGNMMYDFFIGRELNPRITIPSSRFLPLIGGQVIDIKCFNELRPGLLGWIILNVSFAARQYRVYGFVSDSMILCALFQALYVFDGLYVEEQLVSQIDITNDGFGYMLTFGDLVWLPFIYSLQCRYLASYPVHLGLQGIAVVLGLQGLGYYIFRAANNEKNRFRADPSDPRVSHLESITTASGSKLLTSGWWGRARHVNYFGDWIMAVSYCAPTAISGYLIHYYTNPVTGNVTREVEQGDARGWGMVFTYFYLVYFVTLLLHRERRDEEKCRRKYGKDWDRYCEKVKSRIIPGIY